MIYYINDPEPGTYQMRKTKGGVWVPVLIWRPCMCTINGPDEHHWQESCDRYCALSALVDGWEDLHPMRVWNNCHPIPRHEYDFLVGQHAWARKHDPFNPMANPKQAVDLAGMKPLI